MFMDHTRSFQVYEYITEMIVLPLVKWVSQNGLFLTGEIQTLVSQMHLVWFLPEAY